jgi:hypothetical protein
MKHKLTWFVLSFVLVLPASLCSCESQTDSTEKASLSIHRHANPEGPGVVSVGWIVTNESTQPITINKFVYNGECQARVGHLEGRTVWAGPNPFDKSSTELPQRLTIGQQVCFFVGNPAQVDYMKKVIFIDVYTDRGNFRYRPFKGLEPLAS